MVRPGESVELAFHVKEEQVMDGKSETHTDQFSSLGEHKCQRFSCKRYSHLGW